jgi:CMP-N-acetylneuraminic acid synthetase
VFIPGRLASERLPSKLTLPLGDSCLWEMALRKLDALPERYVKVALASDGELIEMARRYPGVQLVRRDPKTAAVDGPLKFIFKDLEAVDATHLMFLNPCLSLLTVETVVKALEEFEQQGMDYATSVKPLTNWLFDDEGKPVNAIDYERLTTKEIEPLWQAAHCFHIFDKEGFFADGMMLKPGHGVIEVPAEESIDVDSPADYEFAKWKHAKRYVIDMDDTIQELTRDDAGATEARPVERNIRRVNRLHDAGNTIVLWTAQRPDAEPDLRRATTDRLKRWGVKYHELLFGKPEGDVFVDAKATSFEEWK